MNQFFNFPADGNLVAGSIPENVQAIAEQTVNTTRETYTKLTETAKGGARLVQEMASTTQTATKAIGDKLLENASKNANAFFDAAAAIARAKTIQEAASLHADYMQKQFTLASMQAKELFDLSALLGTQGLQRMTSRQNPVTDAH